MPDLTDTERAALHELQLGVEHIHRAYGRLLGFHHSIGRGMDHLDDAQQLLRDAGHDDYANALRDHHLPAGAIEDRWSYELVEAYRDGLLAAIDGFDDTVRDDLADGHSHVTERRQRRRWRDRARD
jgi:hypothetical protein